MQNNHIVENDYGITVEEGVAVNMDGNVVEKNKLGGEYFDEEKRAEGAPPTGEHMLIGMFVDMAWKRKVAKLEQGATIVISFHCIGKDRRAKVL